MSVYRRFVTYLFRYENGAKKENCGFAKLETRQGCCRMELQIRDCADGRGSVYLFHSAKRGPVGVRIGDIRVHGGSGAEIFIFDEESIGASPYGLDDMSGIYISPDVKSESGQAPEGNLITHPARQEKAMPHPVREENAMPHPVREENAMPHPVRNSAVFIASQWDDGAVNWEVFHVYGKGREHPEEDEIGEQAEEAGAIREEGGEQAEEAGAIREEGGEQSEEAGTCQEGSGKQAEEAGAIREEGGEQAEEAGACQEGGGEQAEEAGTCQEESGEQAEEAGKPRKKLTEQECEAPGGGNKSPDESAPAADDSLEGCEMQASVDISPAMSAWEKQWQRFCALHPVLCPFDEAEDIYAVKMDLRDLRILPKQYRALANNSFLLHGYFNYRYLLFGYMGAGEKRWFIAVPGVFQNQEQVLAGIFGFTEFRTKHRTKQRTGEFGFWYRHLTLQ